MALRSELPPELLRISYYLKRYSTRVNEYLYRKYLGKTDPDTVIKKIDPKIDTSFINSNLEIYLAAPQTIMESAKNLESAYVNTIIHENMHHIATPVIDIIDITAAAQYKILENLGIDPKPMANKINIVINLVSDLINNLLAEKIIPEFAKTLPDAFYFKEDMGDVSRDIAGSLVKLYYCHIHGCDPGNVHPLAKDIFETMRDVVESISGVSLKTLYEEMEEFKNNPRLSISELSHIIAEGVTKQYPVRDIVQNALSRLIEKPWLIKKLLYTMYIMSTLILLAVGSGSGDFNDNAVSQDVSKTAPDDVKDRYSTVATLVDPAEIDKLLGDQSRFTKLLREVAKMVSEDASKRFIIKLRGTRRKIVETKASSMTVYLPLPLSPGSRIHPISMIKYKYTKNPFDIKIKKKITMRKREVKYEYSPVSPPETLTILIDASGSTTTFTDAFKPVTKVPIPIIAGELGVARGILKGLKEVYGDPGTTVNLIFFSTDMHPYENLDVDEAIRLIDNYNPPFEDTDIISPIEYASKIHKHGRRNLLLILTDLLIRDDEVRRIDEIMGGVKSPKLLINITFVPQIGYRFRNIKFLRLRDPEDYLEVEKSITEALS